MNLGSEPNPGSGDVGKLLKALGLFYPSYLSLEPCPCGAEVDTALCEACHIWKDRTFVWVSPGGLGSSHLHWTSEEAAAEMGEGDVLQANGV